MNTLKHFRLVLLAVWIVPQLCGVLPTAEAQQQTTAKPQFEVDPVAVQRFGSGWKRPQAGWLVLHIEGSPHDRGFQHGRLLAREIVDYIQALARTRSHKDPTAAWNALRLLTDAVFIRRFDAECLEEMKGIADGAASMGAKFDGRRLDLLDIVALNADVEVGFLESALQATPNGLDAKRFASPSASPPKVKKREQCSAFVTTLPANDNSTGGVMIGHITFSALSWVYHFNVWLDVTPTDTDGKPTGHRFVCQSFPGGIQSGLDYYLSASGLLIAETTIDQTSFNVSGETEASRVRRAVQYATTIDDAVKILALHNNGLYTNEWLIADTKTNEIAMFELGTAHTRLWRSSKDEWPGGTRGLYWGCNNAKDRDVLSDTVADSRGKPGNLVLHPSRRDVAWQKLFQSHRQRGELTEDFGFEAFRTPPIAGYYSSDAKFATSAMAKDLSSYALFGPPLGKSWPVSHAEREADPDAKPLVSNGWTLIRPTLEQLPNNAEKPEVSKDQQIVLAPADLAPFPDDDKPPKLKFDQRHPFAWRGTLLPKTDADTGLAAAFSEFEKIVALENALKAEEAAKHANDKADSEKNVRDKPSHELDQAARDLVDVALFTTQSNWWAARQRLGRDVSLAKTKSTEDSLEWYPLAVGQGVSLLAELRQKLGAATFDRLMDEFGLAHANQAISVLQFREFIEHLAGEVAKPVFAKWLDVEVAAKEHVGGAWSIYSFEPEPELALIVYGTGQKLSFLKKSNNLCDIANREIAERLQHTLARRGSNHRMAIKADQDVTEDDLKSHHLLVVGEPLTNSLLKKSAAKSSIRFGSQSLTVQNESFADLDSGVIVAAENPWNARFSVVLFAGLSARATHRIVDELSPEEETSPQVVLFPANRSPRRFVIRPDVR